MMVPERLNVLATSAERRAMKRRRPRFIVQRQADHWLVTYSGKQSAFSSRDLALRAAVSEALLFHNNGLPSDVLYVDEDGREALWRFDGRPDLLTAENEVLTIIRPPLARRH